MGSNALKATILDRGHAKEASRGVESHFAAQGTIRQRIRQRGGSGGAADPAAGGAAGVAAGAAPGKDSWEGFLQNRNPHECAIEGGVKDPMGRHDV